MLEHRPLLEPPIPIACPDLAQEETVTKRNGGRRKVEKPPKPLTVTLDGLPRYPRLRKLRPIAAVILAIILIAARYYSHIEFGFTLSR